MSASYCQVDRLSASCCWRIVLSLVGWGWQRVQDGILHRGSVVPRSHCTSSVLHGSCCAALSWLRPYNNGTLPNAKVRSELVALLKVLQLETTNDYVREKLEESELGKIIMFYYKNPNESSKLGTTAIA